MVIQPAEGEQEAEEVQVADHGAADSTPYLILVMVSLISLLLALWLDADLSANSVVNEEWKKVR